MEINDSKEVQDDQSQGSLQLLKHVPSKTQQKIKSFKKTVPQNGNTLCHCIPPFSKGTTWAHDQFTLSVATHGPRHGNDPCPAIHLCRLCQFSITQFHSPLKWAKCNSSIFPPDSQVKLVQQQIPTVKAQETQDCIATSRGEKGKIPSFGGKVLLYHPGCLWNDMLRS